MVVWRQGHEEKNLMPFVKLKFQPGVDKEGTNYENTIGWHDTDKVRFRQGQPER